MSAAEPRASRRLDVALAAALLLLVAVLYAPVRTFPFVVYDDKHLVSENPHVLQGLRLDEVAWLSTHAYSGNYVPLTWLSHMLDVELFGLDAGAHHVMNAALHAAATLLLFTALRCLGGAPAPSAFVAALFGVHPAHVESVAWISERRDTLSAVFFMWTLVAWARWLRAPGPGRMAQVMLCLGLGLLAKAMLMTLPVVLLLLDRWPLGRREPWAALVREKLPLFALTGVAAVVAVIAQRESGAVASLALVPLADRVANALVAAASYVRMTIWPSGLAVFHPFEFAIPAWKVASSALLLLGATAAAWTLRRRQPWWLTGWLWYAVTLLPVVGLLQVGSQGMAERYTYLPMVGLGIAVAFAADDLARRAPRVRPVLTAAGLALVAVWTLLARAQLETWRDSITLFEHARAVSGEHPIIDLNLGEAWIERGRDDLARIHYERGLAVAPDAPQLQMRLGLLLARTGEPAPAARHLARAAAGFEAAGRRSDAIEMAQQARAEALRAGKTELAEGLSRQLEAWGIINNKN
jgi:hypothetical protein